MLIQKELKIREENECYLLINLSSDSILKGYPSFFKINKTSKDIIEFLLTIKKFEPLSFAEKYCKKFNVEVKDLLTFLDFLKKYGVCYEE